MMLPSIAVMDLGLVCYSEAMRVQASAVDSVLRGGEPSLFLLEHHPTITFGRNGGPENLPFEKSYFTARGVAVAQTSRGGNITCHFPGQLVVYPILRIDKRAGGLRRFFYDMEEVILRTVQHFGIVAGREEGRPGVWVESRKIASIGIGVKRWVTSHGVSINLGRDLSLFDEVAPCGLAGVQATSLHRELASERVSMQEFKQRFLQEFCSVFAMKAVYLF